MPVHRDEYLRRVVIELDRSDDLPGESVLADRGQRIDAERRLIDFIFGGRCGGGNLSNGCEGCAVDGRRIHFRRKLVFASGRRTNA